MSSNLEEVQNCTNISMNTLILDKPNENNDISIVGTKENNEQEKNPGETNFNIIFPNALDEDSSVTGLNDNIGSDNENEDLVNSLISKKK